MPPAVPIIAAYAGAQVAAAAGVIAVLGTVGASIAGMVVATGINALGSKAFAKKPKKFDFASDAQAMGTIGRSSVETHKLIYGRQRVSGPRTFAHTANSAPDSNGDNAGGTNMFLYIILPLAGHQVNSIGDVYINEELATLDANGFVTSAPYFHDGKSYLRITKHLGGPGQVADAGFVTELPGVWTTDHVGNNIAYLAVRAQANSDAFPAGYPNIAAVVDGKLVYDPRSNAVVWTDNAVLCTRDYLRSECDIADDRFDDTNYTIPHANIADESVTLLDSSTQHRYTCNGMLDTGTSRKDNLTALTASMAGEVIRVGDLIRIFSGAYEAPGGTITESMLAGEISGTTRASRDSSINTVQGIYIDPTKNWQATDFPPVTNATYIAQDNGQEYAEDLNLPLTNHPEAAQRIAKVILEKARQGITTTLPLNDSALKYACGDTVALTLSFPGWNGKEFRIRRFNLGSVPNGVFTVSLQEESAASYDWNAGEATVGDTAPDTTIPNVFVVEALTGVAFNSRAVDTRDGDLIYNLVLTWEQHPNMFVREGGSFEIQYRLSTDTAWRPSFFVDGALTSTDVLTSSVNTSYDLRIRARNNLLARSGWVTIEGAVVGSSGGVGSTDDYGEWVSSPGSTADYGDFVSSPGSTEDYGYFT